MGYCRPLLRRLAFALAVLAAGRGGTAPVQDDAAGTYRDALGDATGLEVVRNAVVGPSLTPGVRVALSRWNFVQSYSPTSNSISVPFSEASAVRRMTVVEKASSSQPWETVSLWRQTYRVATDLPLHPLVTSTTFWPGFPAPQPLTARMGGIEALTPLDYFGGPFASLVPNEGYTATFKSFYCDDPTCKGITGPPSAEGAEIGVYTVAYGGLKTEFPIRVGAYGGVPAGDFSDEGDPSPATLEWTVPSPLPPGLGWEYRLRMTFSADGQPAAPPCAPSCSVSLWVETVSVMAKGRQIQAIPIGGACGGGQKPCNGQCIPDTLPCGWDVSTSYVTSGSYLSPVFDSLSNNTVWNNLWWSVEQNFSGVNGGWPTTPVGIKWRVGNDPDPGSWLPDKNWFHWTIENSVTCAGEEDNCSQVTCAGGPCDCAGQPGRLDCLLGEPFPYRVPMKNEDEVPLFTDGVAKAATGRYFQIEVDLSNNYANDRYPPEFSNPPTRELHEALRPVLRALRLSYTPARGSAVSKVVRPQQLRRWRAVEYTTDVASGGTVVVDVLDEFGVPLFTAVPSGFSLAGLAPDRYPALKLRAYVDNGGNALQRPILTSWALKWDTFSEPLQLDRNAVDVARNDVVSITVVMTVSRPGTLSLHDATGTLVREFYSGVFGAGIRTFVWNGRNARGDAVAAGVYYVTLAAKEIKRIKTIAVLR